MWRGWFCPGFHQKSIGFQQDGRQLFPPVLGQQHTKGLGHPWSWSSTLGWLVVLVVSFVKWEMEVEELEKFHEIACWIVLWPLKLQWTAGRGGSLSLNADVVLNSPDKQVFLSQGAHQKGTVNFSCTYFCLFVERKVRAALAWRPWSCCSGPVAIQFLLVAPRINFCLVS